MLSGSFVTFGVRRRVDARVKPGQGVDIELREFTLFGIRFE